MDLLRIEFFLRSMRGIAKVAVPLEEKEARAIEKWPMVKSYALEEIGTGFFSQNHQVVPLSAKINTLFKNHDCFSLAQLAESTGAMLAGHVYGAATFFELTEMRKRALIT